MSDEKHGFLGVVFTFLTGAALGAGLALVFAPQTGEETRKKIKDFSEKMADEVKENYEKLNKETQKAIETVKTTSEKAVSQIKTAIEGAAEGINKNAPKTKAKTSKETATKAKS